MEKHDDYEHITEILSRAKCRDASKPNKKDVRKINLHKSHQLCQNYFTKKNSTSSYVWRQNPLKSQEQRCQPLYSQKLHESQILNKSSSFCWFNTTLLPPGITKLLLMSGAATKISLWHLSPRKNLLWSSPVIRVYLYNEALPCDQRWIIRGNNTLDWSEEGLHRLY